MTARHIRAWLVIAALLAAGVIAVIVLGQRLFVLDAPRPRIEPEIADTLPPIPESVVEAPIT